MQGMADHQQLQGSQVGPAGLVHVQVCPLACMALLLYSASPYAITSNLTLDLSACKHSYAVSLCENPLNQAFAYFPIPSQQQGKQ